MTKHAAKALSAGSGEAEGLSPSALDFAVVRRIHPPFAHAGGVGWISGNITLTEGSSPQSPYLSRLVLLEDGRALGPPNASHGWIREAGEGRHCHWQDFLLFSSSDNSDPNTNGRVYQIALLRGRVRAPSPHAAFGEALVAVYDLGGEMVTHDFAWFMALAEAERRRRGLECGHVVLVPGWRADGLRDERPEYERGLPPAQRRARINNLLVPLAGLFDRWTGVTLLSSRAQAQDLLGGTRHLFPADYHPFLPRMIYVDARQRVRDQGLPAPLVPPPGALARVEGWLDGAARGRRVVTITLRDHALQPDRNSDVEAWRAFARALPESFLPVFLPDPERPAHDHGITEGLVAEAVAGNPQLRAALYHRAFLNLGLWCGPMALCQLNPACRYLVFGGEAGDDGIGRKVVSEPDRPEVIHAHFHAIVAEIQEQGSPSP